MKTYFIIVFVLLPFYSAGQQLDSCGRSKDSKLNSYEAAYFNNVFEEKRKEFNFSDKKALFITGNSGSIIGDKAAYFKNVKEWAVNNNKIASYFIPLDAKQTAESGGYNVIVTYWVKFLIPVDRVVRKVKRNASKT